MNLRVFNGDMALCHRLGGCAFFHITKYLNYEQ